MAKRYKVFKKIEDSRNDYKTDIILNIKPEDSQIAGFPKDFRGFTSLVLGNSNTVHFAYPNSPEMWLLDIDYKPEYQQTTNGYVQGRTGSALLGAALLGDAGAVAGSSRKKRINTTTIQSEVGAYGLLTFGNLYTNQYLKIECILSKDIYYTLVKQFLHVENYWSPEQY